MKSANRSGSGAFETAAARWRSHTRDTCVVWNLDECVDETLHCNYWRGAWEENTLCRTGEKEMEKIRLSSSPGRGGGVDVNSTVKTYSDLSWLELLEMLCHLFFAAELDLTLRTFIIYVLRRLFFFARKYLPWGRFGIWGCLA